MSIELAERLKQHCAKRKSARKPANKKPSQVSQPELFPTDQSNPEGVQDWDKRTLTHQQLEDDYLTQVRGTGTVEEMYTPAELAIIERFRNGSGE